MVDRRKSCWNREEHFVKGDLFDTYDHQVFIDKTHRQKSVMFSSFDRIITIHDTRLNGKDTLIHYEN